MPARLHFSNSLDALADRLIENIGESSGDPFTLTSIATPASAMRDWLKVRVAERMRVAANLAFPPLETLMWERLAERDRHRENPDRLPARLLDTFSFQGLVLARLQNDPPAALRDYLTSPHPEDAARRLCQLAGQLASLFREYEYNRVAERGFPGLAESWMEGQPNFERHLLRGSGVVGTEKGGATDASPRDRLTELRELESWQLDVYHSLFRRDGGLRDRWGAATKTYRYTLPQYAEMALGDPAIPPGAGCTYHLFGLSNISPFHRDLIGRLADATKLGDSAAHFEIYALNPCAEFWEDLLTLRERRARGPRALTPRVIAAERVAATRPSDEEQANGELRDDADENGLLELFGKPGRETIKLWCQLTDHDFNENFKEPPKGSKTSERKLLPAVQRMLLHRMGPLDERIALTPDDTSLRFGIANDPRTELEAVRAEMAQALRDDAELCPEDLAIIPVDAVAMMPLLRAVFAGDDRAPGNVPVLFPDGSTGEGPLLAGFRTLLNLASSDFTRDALIGLLGNPAALQASTLDAARLPTVERLLKDAGFARGWGGVQNGSGDEQDGSSTLVAATERLLASLAFDADDSTLATDTTYPQPVPGLADRMDPGETGALLDWLVKLRDALAPLRDGSKRSFADWARCLRVLSDTLLVGGAEDGRDALDLRRFLDELEAWGAWEDSDDSDDKAVDATLVTMLFADRFRDAEGTGRTLFLRGGVRVGNLAALRGLPFRRVWITGLTSAFPASGDAMPLDLRTYRRLPGESDPAARDLYALLEVISSCMGSVSLSWHRRGTDGKERQPSRALTGMMAWLENDVLPAGAPFDFVELKAPPSLPPSHTDAAPVTFAEEPAQARIHKLGDVGLYLRNPVLHATSRLFRSDEWDALDEREPDLSEDLFIDGWTSKSLLDACLRAELAKPGTATTMFDHIWTTRRRGGLVPPPPWSDAEEARLRTELEARLQGEAASLRVILNATGLRFVGALRLGPQGAERPDPPVRNLPPFDASALLNDSTRDLQLGGILPWFFRGPDGWALLTDPDRDMTGYLVQLCATVLKPLPRPLAETFAGNGRLLVRAKDGGAVTEQPLPVLDTTTARVRLRDLLGDFARALHGEGHLDDVPLDEIAAVLKDADGNPDTVNDWAEAILERREEADENGRQRVSRGERRRRAIDPELPDNLDDLVRRRVLPYLQWKDDLSNPSDMLDAQAD